VVFAAGRAAFEVRPHPWDRGIGVTVGELELDVSI
jgi:hypothetical protein